MPDETKVAPWPTAQEALAILCVAIARLTTTLRGHDHNHFPNLSIELDDDIFDAIVQPKRDRLAEHLRPQALPPFDAPFSVGGITLRRRVRTREQQVA
jgi:hypothetical protein